MPKTRQEKEEAVKDLTEKVKNSKSLVFVDFDGLKVKEIEALRQKCREENVGYLVAKKTLMKLAFAEAGLTDTDPKTFDRGVATVFGYEDEVAPARIVSQFAKEHDALKTVGGVLEGKYVTSEKVIALSKLPSRDELLAKIVGSINVLAGNLRGLVGVLNAIKDTK